MKKTVEIAKNEPKTHAMICWQRFHWTESRQKPKCLLPCFFVFGNIAQRLAEDNVLSGFVLAQFSKRNK